MDTYTAIFAISIGLLFFARLPLGIMFFNRENNTEKGLFDYSRAEQTVFCFYWYKAEKKENKVLAQILNTILIIVAFVFIGAIVYSESRKYTL